MTYIEDVDKSLKKNIPQKTKKNHKIKPLKKSYLSKE